MRANHGITLIELLITVTIVSILGTVAVPSLYNLINQNRMTTVTNTLLSSFRLARSEAIKRNQRVTVAASNGDWKQGWTVFVDRNANAIADPGEQILQQHETLRGNFSIHGNIHVRYYVSYLGSGYNRTLNGALQLGTISICDTGSGQHSRGLRVNYAGRWWVSKNTDHINCR